MLPHDLLPIVRPLEDTTQYDETYFYENVIKHLIPDIVQMEANGIPIDLSKVSKLEEVVDNVLSEVHKKLTNNKIMLEFLEKESDKYKKNKTKELENKIKTYKDFLKPFDIKNKIHRTFIVNTYLISQVHDDKVMNEWSIKDLKLLNQIIGSKFIQNILDKKVEFWMEDTINLAMVRLAQTKADIYNKNKIESKINTINEQNLILKFNPSSSIQKQNFFNYYGIESEKETKTGNPSWDITELLRLQKLLGIMIDKEQGNARSVETD